MTKISFTHLIYKGIVTRPYESLSFSCFCFVFFLYFFFLCFFSCTLVLVSHAHCCFLSSAQLLLRLLRCCLVLVVASSCWVHLLPGKLSFVSLFSHSFGWLIALYWMNVFVCCCLNWINGEKNIIFPEKNSYRSAIRIQISDLYGFFYFFLNWKYKIVNYFLNCFVV